MPSYSDSRVDVKESKLTYFHGGFGVQPVYELLTNSSKKIGYQKRFFVERLLTYRQILRAEDLPILFTEGFFIEGLLYYLFKAPPTKSSIFIPRSYEPFLNEKIALDLIKSRTIVWCGDLKEALVTHLNETPSVHVVTQLKIKTDLRPLLEFIGARRRSLLMVLDYASNADKNEYLYAKKQELQVLEHIDESADFLSQH